MENKSFTKRSRIYERSSKRGFTLVEMMFSSVIVLSVLSTILSMVWHSARALDRQQIHTSQGNNARTGVDEVLFHLRNGKQVLASQSVGGTSFTTGSSCVVLSAPGYDPSTPAVFLPGVTDYIAVQYDAANKRLLETCVPGSGSVRAARTNFRVADGVSSFALTYQARDAFTSSTYGPAIYTLSANATAQPVVLINGVASSGTWTSVSPKLITITAPSAKADIQVVYPVDPAASSGAALQYVKQVDLTVTFSTTDSRNITRTLSMAGSARLRNQRL